MNHEAIDAGATAFVKIDVPADWANAADEKAGHELAGKPELVTMVKEILEPVGRMDGDSLPVSVFVPHVDGQFELGAAAYEKRGVAVSVPMWDPDKCIQCNTCAYVCPHATIRTFALTEDEVKNAPEGLKTAPVKAGKGKGVYTYAIGVSPLDCMGCGVCVEACLAGAKDPEKRAIKMVPQESQAEQAKVWDYLVKTAPKADMQDNTVKGSQFKQPYLEFSGSCAGCAETSYARLVTQLFGDRMYISNATGCSSIWGGPAATSPYCTNAEGKGPAWCNSLFEDNAEHGLGMYVGQKAVRNALAEETKARIAVEWARIPHFYYNYYVYQYATGYSAAIALSRRILKEGESAVKDMLGFLSGGCSQDPIDLLRGAGVDMASPKPVQDALDMFGALLDEMEALLAD